MTGTSAPISDGRNMTTKPIPAMPPVPLIHGAEGERQADVERQHGDVQGGEEADGPKRPGAAVDHGGDGGRHDQRDDDRDVLR